MNQDIPAPKKHKGIRGANLPVDVNYKTLIKQVADSSEYYEYEVEDILLHFVHCMHLNFQKGYTVGIKNLGKFSVRETKVKATQSNLTGTFLPERIDRKVHFSAAEETKHYINGRVPPVKDEDADSEY